MTKYTFEIFEILKKGRFICSNSPDDNIKKLYRILEDEDNFEQLYEYFSTIKYELNQGDEYFYFSKKENNTSIEKKLEKAYDWIGILDFFKTYDSAFTVGTIFTPFEIHTQLKNNADLMDKLEQLKDVGIDKKNQLDRIKKAIGKLETNNFITLVSEISETYKVLNSFDYLEELMMSINIPEEVENEIPE